MARSLGTTSINIRPTSGIYATYRRLSYKPWYAIAEFVDNSTQNYYDHRDALRRKYQAELRRNIRPGRLRVEVSCDSDARTLTILDNANGMNMEELTRAIVLDKPPRHPTGRSEFGMGLKTAACWFGTTWTITTTRLGSPRQYTVRVHVPDLAHKHTEEIRVLEQPADRDSHFTRIVIEGLYKPIVGRTVGRIRDQLASMYRVDLRAGEIEIGWNGESLTFEDQPILEESNGGVITKWRKRISLKVPWEAEDRVLKVAGWIGVRTPGSQRDAGFVLLRRGRVIVGGPGEGYKPPEIFGQGNTFRSQRLIGELDLNDWPITQAKDAFDWSGGLEDAFIEHLKQASRDYMDKAEAHRQAQAPVTVAEMQQASETTRAVLENPQFATAIEHDLELPDPPKSPRQEQADFAKLRAASRGPVIYTLQIAGARWEFRLHWQDSISDAHWMSIDCPDDRLTNIYLNIGHPFFASYLGRPGFLEVLQKFVVALALAERMALRASSRGLVAPGDFRNFMNKVLRHAATMEAQNDG